MKEELKNWAKNDKKRLIKNFKGNNGFSPPDNYFPHDRIFTNIPNEKFENPILLLEWVILDIAEEEDLL